MYASVFRFMAQISTIWTDVSSRKRNFRETGDASEPSSFKQSLYPRILEFHMDGLKIEGRIAWDGPF
ncbi:hypothetical protein NL676_007552 [Syzygium grande]|nr:hypothetical protein NL676_007552 [Syzygium grande]